MGDQGNPKGRNPGKLERLRQGRQRQRKGQGEAEQGQEGGGVQSSNCGTGLLEIAPPSDTPPIEILSEREEVSPPRGGAIGKVVRASHDRAGSGLVADAAPAPMPELEVTEACPSEASPKLAVVGSKTLAELGSEMLDLLPSVLGGSVWRAVRDSSEDVFPLPNPLDHWGQGDSCFRAWAEGVVRSVNWGRGRLSSSPAGPFEAASSLAERVEAEL